MAPCGHRSGKKWSLTEPHFSQARVECQVGMLGVYTMVLDDGESIKIHSRVVGPLLFQESLICCQLREKVFGEIPCQILNLLFEPRNSVKTV